MAAVADALKEFYASLTAKLDGLRMRDIVRRKNPYLFRAKGMNEASQVVESILSAFVSSSEETIFGNVFFEPIARMASGGQKALAEGVDIVVERGDAMYAIAVKSGTSVFNSDSKKRQEQNFMAAMKLAQQARKRLVAIVGYGYGRKRASSRGMPKIYVELAGSAFWEELTGDPSFYKKIIRFMGTFPEQYADDFHRAYARASNRLVGEFTKDFCCSDGSIDWEKILECCSGENAPAAATDSTPS